MREKGKRMAINSMSDLLKMFSEVTHDEKDNAISFVQGLESQRVDMLSKSTEQEDLFQAAQGKIAELEGQVTTLNENVETLTTENTELKARNYDLIMQVPTGEPIPGGENPLKNKMGDDGTVYHISNMFSEAQVNPMNFGTPQPINNQNGGTSSAN